MILQILYRYNICKSGIFTAYNQYVPMASVLFKMQHKFNLFMKYSGQCFIYAVVLIIYLWVRTTIVLFVLQY